MARSAIVPVRRVEMMMAGLLLLLVGFIRGAGAFSNDVSTLARGLPTTPAAAVTIRTLHSPRFPKHTAGVELSLDEVQREPAERGTRVTYRLKTSGFPSDKVYRLEISSSSQLDRALWLADIRTNESGSLANARGPGGNAIDVSKVTVQVEQYTDGEFYMIEASSEDGTVYAADKVFPFPIAAHDGDCRVWAELMSRNHKSFVFTGSGFGANSVVSTASWEDEGKDRKESSTAVGPNDVFAVRVDHEKSRGVGTFSATGNHCSVMLHYALGKSAKAPR